MGDAFELVRAAMCSTRPRETHDPGVCTHTISAVVDGKLRTRSTLVEEDCVVCTQCGCIVGVVYVRYRHGAMPLYIYNRVSRFAIVLRKLAVPHEDEMCEIFEGLETVWKEHRPKTRKYFLNLRFCIWNIAILFDIDMELTHGVCIKDQARVAAQRKIFEKLLREHNAQHYEAYRSKSSILSETTSDAPETKDC